MLLVYCYLKGTIITVLFRGAHGDGRLSWRLGMRVLGRIGKWGLRVGTFWRSGVGVPVTPTYSTSPLWLHTRTLPSLPQRHRKPFLFPEREPYGCSQIPMMLIANHNNFRVLKLLLILTKYYNFEWPERWADSGEGKCYAVSICGFLYWCCSCGEGLSEQAKDYSRSLAQSSRSASQGPLRPLSNIWPAGTIFPMGKTAGLFQLFYYVCPLRGSLIDGWQLRHFWDGANYLNLTIVCSLIE